MNGGSGCAASVAATQLRSDEVKFGPLRFREEFLVGVFERALERRLVFIRPDALEIGLAPWSLQRRG